MRIVFCGGGTAGHIVPNIALIERLRGQEIYYIGCSEMDRSLLQPIIEKGEVVYRSFDAVKFRRKFSPELVTLPIKLCKSVRECRKILNEIKPDVVFSKGGYASLPVVLAAKNLNCRIYCHESDLSLGLANRISLRYVHKIFTAFKETADKVGKKAVYSGIPLRLNLFCRDAFRGKSFMGFNNRRETILVLGGSLGAARLNEAIKDALPELTKTYNVFTVCGKGKSSGIKRKFFSEIEFTSSLPDIYEACDYIISRAGSNTIAEILCVGKPAILVPLTRATRGEQIENADYCARRGYFLTLNEENITPRLLNEGIEKLRLKKKEILESQKRAKNNASEIILEHILENPL